MVVLITFFVVIFISFGIKSEVSVVFSSFFCFFSTIWIPSSLTSFWIPSIVNWDLILIIFFSDFLLEPFIVNWDFVFIIFWFSWFLFIPLIINWVLVVIIFSLFFLFCPFNVNCDFVLIILFLLIFLLTPLIVNWLLVLIIFITGFLDILFIENLAILLIIFSVAFFGFPFIVNCDFIFITFSWFRWTPSIFFNFSICFLDSPSKSFSLFIFIEFIFKISNGFSSILKICKEILKSGSICFNLFNNIFFESFSILNLLLFLSSLFGNIMLSNFLPIELINILFSFFISLFLFIFNNLSSNPIPLISNWFCGDITALILMNLDCLMLFFFKTFFVVIFISLFNSVGINLSSSFLIISKDLLRFSFLLIEINSFIFSLIVSSSWDILYEIGWTIFNSSDFTNFLALNKDLSISACLCSESSLLSISLFSNLLYFFSLSNSFLLSLLSLFSFSFSFWSSFSSSNDLPTLNLLFSWDSASKGVFVFSFPRIFNLFSDVIKLFLNL